MEQPQNLLACPFCGEDELVTIDKLSGGESVANCQTCGAGTGTCCDDEQARKEWNTRAGGIARGTTDGSRFGASGGSADLDMLVSRFLAWPLPETVCSDLCATERGYPHRSGTNLLTATEAREMIEYLLASPPNGEVSGG